MKRKMIPTPLRVPGTDPKTEFEAFDALATKLIMTPKPATAKLKKAPVSTSSPPNT